MVHSIPPGFFPVMSSLFLNYLAASCVLLVPLAGRAADDATPPGFLEGHLKIFSLKEVELAEENSPKSTNLQSPQYPLIVLSKDGKKQVTRITADEKGNYRLALPPGNYILDVAGRRPGGLRAKPQPFTVVSNQTVRVEMNVETGVR